jgi:multidrug efflux pump subunit AcrA (membrane-fusion protein)
MAVDQNSSGVAFLDTTNDTIEVFSDRQSIAATGTPDNSYALSGLGSSPPTNPTGFAINQRTGDYLILDSTIQSSGATAYVRLFVVNSSVNTVRQIIPIKVNDTQYISTDLRTETNFKIQYDERKNIVYLTAPSVHKTYGLSLPIML